MLVIVATLDNNLLKQGLSGAGFVRGAVLASDIHAEETPMKRNILFALVALALGGLSVA